MIDEFDCSHNEEIVCPYCGYEHSDSWEIATGDDWRKPVDYECDECGKAFIVDIEISTTYSSRIAAQIAEDKKELEK